MNKLDFLNTVVFGYIQKDLEAIKTLPRKSGEPGNANFPIALCILSYVEYLGGFFTGLEWDYTKNVSSYTEKCFPNKGGYNVDILEDIFRNGLAHDYFARGGVGRDGIRPALYRGWKKEVILDADTLLDDFLTSLNKFGDELTDEIFNKRIALAEKRITDLNNNFKDQIDKLPFIGDIPNARTSGATVYPGPINITRPYDPNEK